MGDVSCGEVVESSRMELRPIDAEDRGEEVVRVKMGEDCGICC